MSTPIKVTNTTAIYAPFYTLNRWGDFSQTVVDPEDDQTIWTFQEYAAVDDDYGVRVVTGRGTRTGCTFTFWSTLQ